MDDTAFSSLIRNLKGRGKKTDFCRRGTKEETFRFDEGGRIITSAVIKEYFIETIWQGIDRVKRLNGKIRLARMQSGRRVALKLGLRRAREGKKESRRENVGGGDKFWAFRLDLLPCPGISALETILLVLAYPGSQDNQVLFSTCSLVKQSRYQPRKNKWKK